MKNIFFLLLILLLNFHHESKNLKMCVRLIINNNLLNINSIATISISSR